MRLVVHLQANKGRTRGFPRPFAGASSRLDPFGVDLLPADAGPGGALDRAIVDLSPADHRTRAAYDTVATDYAAVVADAFDANPWERAVLDAYAGEVVAAGGGPVLDAGCGPGRLIGHLRDRGLDVSGVDLSPAMVALARAAHPDRPVTVGTLHALDLADGALAGVVAWYSVIHTAPADQPAIYREFARVLRPGGRLVVAFQVGAECTHLTHAYGHDIDLDAHRLDPDLVAAQLGAAGFTLTARIERQPIAPETHPQAYLFARTPPA